MSIPWMILWRKDVEYRKDAEVLDKIPGAYKPIKQVMANLADLIECASKVKLE